MQSWQKEQKRKKLIPSLLLLAINHHHHSPSTLRIKITYQGPLNVLIKLQTPVTQLVSHKVLQIRTCAILAEGAREEETNYIFASSCNQPPQQHTAAPFAYLFVLSLYHLISFDRTANTSDTRPCR